MKTGELAIRHVHRAFQVNGQPLKAIKDVALDIRSGESRLLRRRDA